MRTPKSFTVCHVVDGRLESHRAANLDEVDEFLDARKLSLDDVLVFPSGALALKSTLTIQRSLPSVKRERKQTAKGAPEPKTSKPPRSGKDLRRTDYVAPPLTAKAEEGTRVDGEFFEKQPE